MQRTLSMLAAVAALVAAGSAPALAQYACPAGYSFYGGACQPAPGYGYAPSNPVSGAVQGEMSGAAAGARAAGPVGAVVGGAVGIATGTVAGTANAVAGVPVCGPGYMLYNGGCYPAR